jgi:hypothetical protein
MTRTSSLTRLLPRLLVLSLALPALAACDRTDPYKREGMWRPSGANDTNFELQVARASDLVMGRGADEGNGFQAAAAIARYENDKERALPKAGISAVGTGGGK